MKKKKTVLVGMSGGVDSSVCAALLKKRGYNVIGITMQLLPDEKVQASTCCNLSAISDAKRVAQKLGIRHYTINSRESFKKNVIDSFIGEYLKGQTPNPCVECNRFIKFDELLKKAPTFDADFVATGHYCLRTYSPKTKKYFLKKGKDPKKDQSYFLYMIPQEKLSKIIFPLGGYNKTQIREMANEWGLINANKKESQEICFVPKSYKDYIEQNVDTSKFASGNVVDIDGNKLGEHNGLYNYTVGQRKGLGITSNIPKYVLKIDFKNNHLVVGDADELNTQIINIKTFTKIDTDEELVGKTFSMKLRYQMSDIKITVSKEGNEEATITTEIPQAFVASGQSAVLYDKDRVVGGGVIRT